MPARAQATRHRGPNVWRAMSGMVAKLELIGLAVGDALADARQRNRCPDEIEQRGAVLRARDRVGALRLALTK
jgi:hypothetical protein